MEETERSGVERRTTPRRTPDRRTGRVMPHSLDAERAVLGALLLNTATMALLPSGFSETAFYRDAHKRIYQAARTLYERQVEVDLLTVAEELKRTGQLDDVGGQAYIASLTDGVPRSTNAPQYAAIVMEHGTRRAIIRLANQLLTAAYAANETPENLIADAQRGVIEVGNTGESRAEPVRALVGPTMQALTELHQRANAIVGTPTGFFDLDHLTAGLQPGELVLLAARPSVGKTALAGNIAEHAAQHGIVLLFSLEMTKDGIMRRLIASKARVEGHKLRTGLGLIPADHLRIANAVCAIARLALLIDDTSALPVEDLLRRAHRVELEHGRLSLIIVDYLQLLRTRVRYENRNQEVSFISMTLKTLAKEMRVPVLALSQLSRAIEGRKNKKPFLSDLRESGSLEQDADVVLFLHRPEDEDELAELIIAKQRNGPCSTVQLRFTSEFTRFDNVTQAAGEQWEE